MLRKDEECFIRIFSTREPLASQIVFRLIGAEVFPL